MKIRRLELRNFRKFIDPVAVEGLGDGLTVISGDNEEGKSTLLKALRTALFDRHGLTGEAVETLRPFGSTVRPEVHLDFELGDENYQLRKGFCQQKFAELDTPSGRINGPAVEETLQKLLHFEPPGRGLARAENQGIWGLFWLEQGTAFGNFAVHAGARQTLLTALEGEVGAVLGGQRGRDLLDAISRRYSEMFDGRDNPRGDYKKALDRPVGLQGELEKVQAALRGYDAKVDELAKARDRIRRYEAEGRLAKALREREEAEQEQRRVEALTAELKTAEQAELVAKADCKTAATRWQRREGELRAAAESSTAVTRLQLAVESERQALAPQETAVTQARTALTVATQTHDQAEAEQRRWERIEQGVRVAENLAGLKKRLTSAITAIQQSTQLRKQADAITIDDKKVRTLRRLETELLEAEAGLNAVATRLAFALEKGATLSLAGQSLNSAQPLYLTETTSLELAYNGASLGTLAIIPGAEDLSERKERAESARRKLKAELAALEVADVTAAEVRAKEKSDFAAQAQQQQGLVNIYAPEGIESLRAAVAHADAELAALGEIETGVSAEQVTQRLQTARVALQDASKLAKRKRSTWEKESQALQGARTALTNAEAELKAAEGTLNKDTDILKAARQRDDDASLRAAYDSAQERMRTSENETKVARTTLSSAVPEEIRLRLESRTKAAELIHKDIEASTKQANDLEIELRTLGQRGLGEREQELQGELEQAQTVSVRFKREGEATKLLHQILRSAEREAKETFLAPVRRRVQPYLNLLMPGSELVLGDDDLSISHLRRGGKDEPFESLSVGTREQLAVLTRLAFADLLREQGQPAAVVLDDALVYADDARFERMLYVLRKAAQHQQILVLTCRERDYVSAGFPVIRLSSCRSVLSAPPS